MIDYEKRTVEIFFEPGRVACQFCPLLETYSRNQCRKTGEYIVDIRVTTGRWCPLKEENNEEVPEM